jgi:hypothetical protein
VFMLFVYCCFCDVTKPLLIKDQNDQSDKLPSML